MLAFFSLVRTNTIAKVTRRKTNKILSTTLQNQKVVFTVLF